MKIRQKSLLVILICVLLYATYYWVVPLVVNIQSRIPLIKSLVKKEFGTEIELKDPELKMGLIPSVWIDASSFEVVDGKESPLEVENPKLKIQLLPLLFGKIHIAYFSCDKINADLKLDKYNRFYIGNYIIMKASNPKLSLDNSVMDISSYEISFKDEIRNKDILLKGDYFDLEKYNPKNDVKFSINSIVKVNGHTSVINTDVNCKLPIEKSFGTKDIVFDGTITNLNLADFSPYIKSLTQNKIKDVSGILNIQADTKALNSRTTEIKTQLALDKFSITEKDGAIHLAFKDKLNINTVYNVLRNTLELKKFKIISGRMNTDITGKVNKMGSKNPVLDLSIAINKSRVEDFIALLIAALPDTKDPSILALKKYGYYSDIEGKVLINGKFNKPKIKGELLSTNAYVKEPPSVPKATVKIKFLGEKLDLDILVPAGGGENVTIKGTVDLYNKKYTDLIVNSTKNVDFEVIDPILIPVHEILLFDLGPLPVMDLRGHGNINLKIKGSQDDPHLTGVLNFMNATASFNGVDAQLKNGEGSLYFEDKSTRLVIQKAFLNNKPIKVNGKCSLAGVLDYDITANGQDLEFLNNVLKKSPILCDIQKQIPPIDKIGGKTDIAVKLSGKVTNINDFAIGKTVFASGNIKLLGDNVVFSSLQIPIKNLYGNIKFKKSDADVDLYSIVDKSKLYVKGKVKNKVLNLKFKPDGVNFVVLNIPGKIYSGNIELNNDKLMLYKVNATMDSMPVLIDGTIENIFKKPNFNLYVNSKPTQKFIEKYLNKNTTYPLKIRGDIIYSARIHGTKEAFGARAEIDMQEDSNIYYMGATLGDANSPIRIFSDTNVYKNATGSSIIVNNFQYDKLITSQNDKEFVAPQLNAKGQINLNKNNINFRNFRVKTLNPTDAKVFNLLFKKPMIKQGLFSSNAILNGPIAAPKIMGFLNFNGIDIPLLDTTIKDISFDFSDKNIDIKSKGEIFSNKIIVLANMQNKLTAPYVINNADIYLGNLDLNQLSKSVNKLQVESDMNKLNEPKQNMDITNLIVKDAKLKADSILVKNTVAKNLTAKLSLTENLKLLLDDFKFEVADGKVNGNFAYNLLNSKSELELHVDNVNANSMAETLFDLQNQIYGSLTGRVDLECNGKTHKTCMDTLSGTGSFRVADGRMPKLGSLEYLLKSANLVKSGVTGITLNSLINLVTPLKTGQFENINGNFAIKSGIANSIQIFSKGQDLSVFLTGTYNFSTLIADLQIFGRISKKVSTSLGSLGNASLNSLFNTIPGINLDEANKSDFIKNINKIPGVELNDKSYRIFSAEIYGDINGENYVQSFKWVD